MKYPYSKLNHHISLSQIKNTVKTEHEVKISWLQVQNLHIVKWLNAKLSWIQDLPAPSNAAKRQLHTANYLSLKIDASLPSFLGLLNYYS